MPDVYVCGLQLTNAKIISFSYWMRIGCLGRSLIHLAGGTTFFMLGNLALVNRPDFIRLNLGCRITGKDVVSLELITYIFIENQHLN